MVLIKVDSELSVNFTKCLLPTVFSLNFTSAGKGPFIAGKEKNVH